VDTAHTSRAKPQNLVSMVLQNISYDRTQIWQLLQNLQRDCSKRQNNKIGIAPIKKSY
jgi:hypothetical protein